MTPNPKDPHQPVLPCKFCKKMDKDGRPANCRCADYQDQNAPSPEQKKCHPDGEKCTRPIIDLSSPHQEVVERFDKEFGIHFKDNSGELQFALEFIREEIEKARQEGAKAERERVREWIDRLDTPRHVHDTVTGNPRFFEGINTYDLKQFLSSLQSVEDKEIKK